VLRRALIASTAKITVFLFAVLSSVVIIGAVMYMIEGPENGFKSIPLSIYWAIVTLTTVGYGDIAPSTMLGQFLAAIVMIMGYGIIAVPTGIVSVALNKSQRESEVAKSCPECGTMLESKSARYCHHCGIKLDHS